jgi:hypothetical protein
VDDEPALDEDDDLDDEDDEDDDRDDDELERVLDDVAVGSVVVCSAEVADAGVAVLSSDEPAATCSDELGGAADVVAVGTAALDRTVAAVRCVDCGAGE